MSDHISRKELKQDKIHDAIEHGAEAFYLHKQVTLIVLLVILAGAIGYGSWSVYHDRQTAAATVALDTAMKAYTDVSAARLTRKTPRMSRTTMRLRAPTMR